MRDNSFIIGSNPAAGHPEGMKLALSRIVSETWPPLDWIFKYQKSAGFIRVARYPYGGLGCNAKLNTAFDKPKNSLLHFLKIPALIQTPASALKISPARGERQHLYRWLDPAVGHPGWDEICAITEVSETWPPLDWILKYQKKRGILKGSALPLWRLRLQCHIEHRI